MLNESPLVNTEQLFLKGGGEMGELMRAKDWSLSPVGAVNEWPQSLKTTISIILNSRFPMFLFWGPELTCFYNDAYRPSLGQDGKHPNILGAPAKEYWQEIWEFIGPMIDSVLSGGGGTWNVDQLLPIYRNGKMEDVYWTFSYSPVTNEKGVIAGVFVTCSETTEKVISFRELSNSNVEQQSLNEEMSAINEELITGNEELTEANAQLLHTQNELTATLKYLQESEARFRLMSENVDIMISVADEDGKAVYFNKAWANLTGKSMDELLEFGWAELIHPEDKDDWVNKYLTAHEKQESLTGEFRVLNYAGEYRWVLAKIPARFRSDGNFAGYISSCIDITDRKLSEENQIRNTKDLQNLNEWISASNEDLTRTQYELEGMVFDLGESEARFRFLVQQAPVAIFILKGRELLIEVMNTRMLKMLGKSAGVVGKTYIEAMPEFEGQSFFKLLDDVFTSGQPFYGNDILAKIEHAGEIKDGYYNFIYEPIKNDQGITNSVMCVAIDVTEQVNARKEIERAEESLRLAVDAAELASYYIDINSRIFVASPRLKEFFGYYAHEDVPYEAAINTIHPDYRQAAADLVEKAITEGIKFDMEYPVIGHHDGKIRWVRGVGTVQNDNNGIPHYFTGVLHDITERKQDDTRKSDFIGMVSHELKTPLTSLTALVQVANSKLKDSEDKFLAGAMEKASVQVKKMIQMINGFLNISRLESGKIAIDMQDFDMEKLIEEIIDEQELVIRSHTFCFEPCKPVMIHADKDKISSVLTNLISNAIKYSPKGKTVDIKCELKEKDVLVSIRDEGMGIKPEDLENVFKRYFRVTSNQSQHISGFGIGLYLSSEIIHRHDGRIWAESDKGNGSTFYFSLPLTKQLQE
ncbi:PAS domain S-box protein [Mucilaginibacter sp.]|uniref:PAS domain S-box protein n=1 Tax=Mucilaginibacter sp. TaxID=1882438 RepID=UPI003D0A7208